MPQEAAREKLPRPSAAAYISASARALGGAAHISLKYLCVGGACAVGGGLMGTATHALAVYPLRDLSGRDFEVDLHLGAHLGVVTGLAVAALLAAGRPEAARALGLAAGVGLFGAALGLCLGLVTAMGLAALPEIFTALRWYVRAPLPANCTNERLDTLIYLMPAFQALFAGGGALAVIRAAVQDRRAPGANRPALA